ncbi:MAG: hypothetical protein HFACDABA_01167 [Anaerolineales bacterium]|nr:hypothetical protein [Anaerolineales bacterium]
MKQDILRAFYPTFIGVLIGLVLGGLLWIVVRSPDGNAVTLQPPPTVAPLVVDVAGAVPRPGVYEFPTGARVKDAVQAAGGLLAEANKSSINLAAPLEDGQRLEIPYLAGLEPTPPAALAFSSSTNSDGSRSVIVPSELIDINIATLQELETLPGIGPSLAQAIIDYRDEFGPFFAIEDLLFVNGIGPETFEAIKDLIMVEF